ncbi:MAG: penicillin-binding protein [Cetobacterium sp.]|uniref:penicillin-binding protein n=1 Tax=Cetobacterium sp. TaxID=2071632 RepID=UPI002FCB2660
MSLILGIGCSIYFKIHLLTVGLMLILVYLLLIFTKWKKNKKNNNFNIRVSVGIDIVGLLMLVLIFRLIHIQVFNSKIYEAAVAKQITGSFPESGDRGSIYDSTGKGLAYNVNIYSLIIDPETAIKKEESFKALKELIDKKYVKGNYYSIAKEIKKLGLEGRRYRRLEKDLNDIEKKEVDIILKKHGILRTKELFLDGRKERKYYRRDIFENLVGNIGFLKNDETDIKKGTFGVEKQYEQYLRGNEIKRTSPSIRSLGIKLPTSKAEMNQELDGKNIHLTIDHEIHYILNDELKKQFENTKSEEAYGIVVDPNTGKVLGTSFYSKGKKEIRNPLFQNQVEPGSIFKPVIVASALNEGYVRRSSTFDIGDGTIKKYNHTIRESSRSVKGIITLDDIIKKSSNVGMVLIGDRFTETKFEEYLKSFGLYDKTGIDFPYERKPYTISSKRWDKLKKSTMSFGQGIAVTPIQMVMAFSAIVNGGVLYRPYLVEKVEDKNGVVIRRNLPAPVRKIISEKVSQNMREMMEKTVEDGTAKKAMVEGYRIGGKTGTAQLSLNGKYIKHEYLTSAIGFFPVEKPRYVVLIMLLKPQADILYNKFGGATAAPVLGEVVRRIVKSKNILSKEITNINPEIQKIKSEQVLVPEEIMTTMPDLKDLTARDILNIFKNYNYEISMSGTGKAFEQYPKAGEELEKVKKIRILLK